MILGQTLFLSLICGLVSLFGCPTLWTTTVFQIFDIAFDQHKISKPLDKIEIVAEGLRLKTIILLCCIRVGLILIYITFGVLVLVRVISKSSDVSHYNGLERSRKLYNIQDG